MTCQLKKMVFCIKYTTYVNCFITMGISSSIIIQVIWPWWCHCFVTADHQISGEILCLFVVLLNCVASFCLNKYKMIILSKTSVIVVWIILWENRNRFVNQITYTDCLFFLANDSCHFHHDRLWRTKVLMTLSCILQKYEDSR